MARGFESKSVADQQESALAAPRPAREGSSLDPLVLQKRRGLELGRADVLRRMETASADGHRQVLKKALDAIDKELKRLG